MGQFIKENLDRLLSALLQIIGTVLGLLSIILTCSILLNYLFSVFGILFLIAGVLCELVYTEHKTVFDYLGIGYSFFVSVVICAFMIARITDERIQTIILSLSSAIYGGILTLIGVAWTIKKSDKDRKEDEIKKERPVFSYNMMSGEPQLGNTMPKICFSDTQENNDLKCDVFVELENSNRSSFEIKRIYHDLSWVNLEGNRVVLPKAKCILNFRFTNYPECIFLEVEDLLKIKHYYQLKVLFLNSKVSSGKVFHTVREINEIEEIEMNKTIKKAITKKE